jgi:hypothetical protein
MQGLCAVCIDVRCQQGSSTQLDRPNQIALFCRLCFDHVCLEAYNSDCYKDLTSCLFSSFDSAWDQLAGKRRSKANWVGYPTGGGESTLARLDKALFAPGNLLMHRASVGTEALA